MEECEKETHHVPLIDGIPCGAIKFHSDNAVHLRYSYGRIFNWLDDLPDLTPEDF